MKRFAKRLFEILPQSLLGVGALSVMVACSPVQFSTVKDEKPATPAVTGGGGGGGTCTTQNVEAIYRQTKLIFVVDTSGSNGYDTSYTGSLCGASSTCVVPATDPLKAFRGGVISDFLDRFRHKANFNWNFMTFAGTSASSLINQAGNDQMPVISNSPDDMRSALIAFGSIKDYGKTPYRAALNLARVAIQNDPDLHSTDNPNYYVILLTDGFPTDYVDTAGGFAATQMQNDVNALLGVASGRVNLSAIFYGTSNDPNAIQLLKSVAAMGGGQFANVNNSNSGFKIDDVIPGSTKGCP